MAVDDCSLPKDETILAGKKTELYFIQDQASCLVYWRKIEKKSNLQQFMDTISSTTPHLGEQPQCLEDGCRVTLETTLDHFHTPGQLFDHLCEHLDLVKWRISINGLWFCATPPQVDQLTRGDLFVNNRIEGGPFYLIFSEYESGLPKWREITKLAKTSDSKTHALLFTVGTLTAGTDYPHQAFPDDLEKSLLKIIPKEKAQVSPSGISKPNGGDS
nr:uncharacterized protein CTRU02_09009 [Colletotrichum truncatum]KAF6789217.1 hypothetical protein CTRU02_09009 [Colletotrichum truncatum]